MAKKKEIDKSRSFHRRLIILIAIGAITLSLIIASTDVFRGLENRSIDWRFNSRGEIKPEAPIIIVAIDDESFKEMPDRWVWPRDYYAKAIRNLKAWGVKAVGFDVIYSEGTAKNPKEDNEFGKALKETGNVVLGMGIFTDSGKNYNKVYTSMPIPVLRDNAYGVGLIHHAFDEDTSVRKSILVLDHEGKRYYSLGLKLLGLYYGLDEKDIQIHGGILSWGKMRVHLYAGNKFLVNFAGPPKSFRTVPFHQVYYGNKIQKSIFKDKIVLIGATSDILHDVFPTPFSTMEIEGSDKQMHKSKVLTPGVEIHANVINTIMSGNYMNRMGSLEAIGLLILIGLLTSFTIFSLNAWQGLIVTAAEIVAYIVFAVYLFDKNNYIIDFVNPIFTMVFCFLSISTYKVAVEEREKRKIKNLFSKYVSSALVDEILKTSELKLGGEKKTISVLFSDIRGFTAMSEKMQPEEVLGILNEYLTEMTDTVFKNGGTLDKFIGDAVMALFGTPIAYNDHALRAVKTGWMMRQRLADLNKKWEKEGKKTLKIGIGINSGEVVAGNMGSMQRMEYTVIGDTVNLASRLESLNKELGTEMLISESTYEQVRGFVEVKKFMDIKIKGKEHTLAVYEVTGLK